MTDNHFSEHLPDAVVVTLAFPAAAEHVRLARLVASGIASQARFAVDEIEDLRIGVDELCSLLIQDGSYGLLTIRFELAGEELTVLATAAHPQAAPEFAADDLSLLILAAVTDDYSISHDSGPPGGRSTTVSLRKRRLASL